MTVRTDLTYNLNLSPRLITVQAPSTELTLQDLLDTTRIFEAESASMDDGHLINAAGKEPLGGGTAVGITATLQNAQVAFEGRDVATSTGTVTSNDATGTLLTDTGATFVADAVARGATIVNRTTGAACEVLTIAANALTTTVLQGGSRQTWLISDTYSVFNVIQCEISGGNLTAVNSVGDDLNSVFTTAYTQIIRTSSSSATISTVSSAQITLIEQLLRNKTVLDPSTGKFEVYDDAGVLLISGDTFEDAAGTTPYSSSSSQVERRERLT